MELVKDIYFNTDKLVENTKIKVSYTGKFYQGNNEKVYLHYGYGKNWNNVNEVEMSKTDLGYQAELKLLPAETLNFCFKNQNNEWDNNFGKNYVFNIEKNIVTNKGQNKEGFSFFEKAFGNVGNFENANNVKNAGTSKELKEDVPHSFDTIIPFENNVSEKNITAESSTTANSTKNIFAKIETNSQPANIANVAGQQINDTKFANQIVNNAASQTASKAINQTANQPANNCYAVIKTVPGDTQVVATINPSQLKSNGVNKNCNETAIALAPTGFNYWTKKIKQTVCNFFEKLPKIISGNYKRDIQNNNENLK